MKEKNENPNTEGELKELIENGLHIHSMKDKTNIILDWSESFPHQTPQRFLGEELYVNYLHYLLVNCIDNYIGNEKKFIPSQKYGQESTRIFMPDWTSLSYEFDYDLGKPSESINWTLYSALNNIDAEINQTAWYLPNRDYRKEYNREFRNRRDNPFLESYLEGIMSESDYKNFLIYRKLYLIDEKRGNCSHFLPTQDYNQEYIRQAKMEHLREGLEKNELFIAFQDAIDTAINSVIFADFEDPIPNDDDEEG